MSPYHSTLLLCILPFFDYRLSKQGGGDGSLSLGIGTGTGAGVGIGVGIGGVSSPKGDNSSSSSSNMNMTMNMNMTSTLRRQSSGSLRKASDGVNGLASTMPIAMPSMSGLGLGGERDRDREREEGDIAGMARGKHECVSLSIVGRSGVGKTYLMCKLAQELRATEVLERGSQARPVLIRVCSTSDGSSSGLQLVQSLIHQLLLVLPNAAASSSSWPLPGAVKSPPIPVGYKEAVTRFQEILADYAVILLLDGVDKLDDTYQVSGGL